MQNPLTAMPLPNSYEIGSVFLADSDFLERCFFQYPTFEVGRMKIHRGILRWFFGAHRGYYTKV